MTARAAASAGLGFLLAVLWFDLMFDAQARASRAGELPPVVLESIAAYYRRVTIAARPMNRLIALTMLGTLTALIVELFGDDVRIGIAIASLVLAGSAILLAALRTVRNAMRLGARGDPPVVQSDLARGILRDHLLCLVAVAAALVMQLALA